MVKRKYKEGELEAKEILESEGYIFNNDYYDDNSEENMPDFQLKDDSFIEVTHTDHEYSLSKYQKNLNKLSLEERYRKSLETNEIYDILLELSYRGGREGLSIEENKLFEKMVKKYRLRTGIDFCTGEHFERNVDEPVLTFSIKNITNQIIKKGVKHKGKNISLFIFVDEAEYGILAEVTSSNIFRSDYEKLKRVINNSCFNKVWIYPYNILYDGYKAKYKYERNQRLLVLTKENKDNSNLPV